MNTTKKTTFSGSIGFVLVAAGSAVGVGNIWRFPYLAAKDGGGLFLILYVALVATFGFTLLVTDVAIGRRTGKNALQAFASINSKWKFLGYLTFLVPIMIMTYYSVIGGWITKYMTMYLFGKSSIASSDGFFTTFISSTNGAIFFTLLFLAITSFIVFLGVEKGIERFSRIVMPWLLLMIIGISIFSLTLHFEDSQHNIRTGLDGLKVYLLPNLEGLTLKRFLEILLDAMSQLFFSLSVSMGIMITYGSYVKKDVNLSKSLGQIELFDTLVGLLAGLMIIPAVYVFFGPEGMSSGPSLMFISLPKIFESMGSIGAVIGFIFFLMVCFAALTSCISILETIVSNFMDIFHTSRKKTCFISSILFAMASAVICMGYNIFYFELTLPTGGTAQLLDLMDYISNSFLMPFISLLTCIFIGYIVKPKWICEEMESSGHKFTRKKLYLFMIRFAVPIMMTILFLQSAGFLK